MGRVKCSINSEALGRGGSIGADRVYIKCLIYSSTELSPKQAHAVEDSIAQVDLILARGER